MEPLSLSLKSAFALIRNSFQKALSTISQTQEKITITTNNYSQKTPFDYACPSAVKLFNAYKKDGEAFGCKSPKELAHLLAENANKELTDIIEPIVCNEQGFIQMKLKESFLESQVNFLLTHGCKYETENKQKVVVDFSSPNIAKEMHVGHLRSTIIGESICRILEFNGNEVLRVNHVGDWGTQFGMLIHHMEEKYPNFLKEMPLLSDLNGFYKEAKERFDKDPAFKKAAQETVVRLQSYQEDCIKAWKVMCDISRKEFEKIYKRLNIKVFEYGESFYNKMIPDTIKECEDRGFVKLDKGAKCMFFEGFENPLMVVKSDGGYNYDSTDLAAVRYRLLDLKVDRAIYITDSGQLPHFLLIFEAAKKMGWLTEKKRLDHMGFGVILGKDGKKFKTRAGEVVKLNDLLDEAFQVAYKGLESRLKENKEGMQTNLQTESEIKEAAEKIGMAAIKYYDLRQNRISDYKFEYDKMLDFKGNTAVYLLYSYVRMCAILRKSGLDKAGFKELAAKGWKITHPHERLLAGLLVKLPETIDSIIDELEIHKLCDLIYNLAVKVAEGYAKYRILDDPNKDTRILLIEAMRMVMEKALFLIGIETIDRI